MNEALQNEGAKEGEPENQANTPTVDELTLRIEDQVCLKFNLLSIY